MGDEDSKDIVENYNPLGKPVFVLYVCPNCGRNDCSCVPSVMKEKIPFFIECDRSCGGFLMYYQAWVTEPMTPQEVMSKYVVGDKDVIDRLKPGGGFLDVTDKLNPDGTMDFSKMLLIDVDMSPMIDERRMKRRVPDKKRKLVSAKQVCPLCGNEFIIKDIDLFLEKTEEAWNIVKKALPPGDVRMRLDNEVYKRNNPDAIRKVLKEKGFITAWCQPCMSKISWAKQLGMDI